MSRRWFLPLLCFALLVLSFVELTRAREELRVNETSSRILLAKDPAEVLLAIENPSLFAVPANVQLELLNPRNKLVATTTQAHSIASGNQTITLSLPFTFPSSNERQSKQLLLYRLHYRISSQTSPAETLADGIISLSEMKPDVFELRIAATEMVREGDRYRVRIRAIQPTTQEPEPNVRIDTRVTLDADKDVKLSGTKLTDTKGNAVFDFELPRPALRFAEPAGGALHVTGSKGAIVVEANADLLVDQNARVLVTTDKPLYQPGQTMHIRALLLTPSRQALANRDTYFKIQDPEDTVLYRGVVTTSRFGVASTDWPIPENTRLGEYRILVGVEGGDDQASQNVRISRYELPNFKVNVDLDRKFYLPGQDATVTVRADYLFGQPVLRGKVRVIRESEREWNYREQKWELKEEAEQKGETKADGSFVAKLDLTSYHQDLKDSDYRRFDDITYAAYFTDPTTNRTEQRRFDVRVTKQPIHVYVVETYDWSYSSELPLQFYVSTFYADGSPARCKVKVTLSDDADDPEITKRVATLTTSRYGLAQVSTRLPKELANMTYVGVSLSASDSNGRKGANTEKFHLDNDRHVRVETDKTIYRPGEAIKAVITVTQRQPEERVIVDLAGEAGLIRSERVRLRGGRGLINFPFRTEFKDRISLVAYPEFAESRSTVGTRTVLYAHNSELNVKVRSSRDTYRPGEDAQVDFSVRSADDRSEESALGVVVVDQAIFERFRTDQEFGGSGYGSNNAIERFLGLEDQLAGVSLRDLQRLDTSRPIPSDLDLLAAVLLRNNTNYYPDFHSSEGFEQDAAKLFGDSIRDQLKPLKNALSDRYAQTMKYPANETELHDSLSQSGIDLNSVRDPWGMPYRVKFSVDKQADTLTFSSSGLDKRADTPDDFVADQMSWAYFRPVGETIDRAIARYHQRTGKFIRDAATLRDEVSTEGLNLDQLYDRWGKPYRLDFDVNEGNFVLNIRSGGPDQRFSPDERYLPDDFIIWRSAIDYFAAPRARIADALARYFNRTKTFPQSDLELEHALNGLGESFASLRDPWGRPYYRIFKSQSVYADRVLLENRATLGGPVSLQTNITPVTRTLGVIVLRSIGPDGQAGTRDDFSVATFSGVIAEQARGASVPVALNTGVVLSGSKGVVLGGVIDPAGAAIPGATVKARSLPTGPISETSTDENGKYSFPSLAPGLYELTFEAPGFKITVIDQVLVRTNNIIEVNATLEPGAVSETVNVTAAAPQLMTLQSAALKNTSVPGIGTNIVTKSGPQISTPRLREYFPETLLWQPSIETSKRGRAQINFKLADNITTWKMVVIGSTEDGRVGTAEREIKAFQPFFVEHDPPRVLTEGDQISLPVVVRNYLSQAQKVELEIKPETWFALLGPAQKQTNVAAGDATRETFDFRVTASVKDGKQRITARGSDDQDAIEKPVSVHPDGEELSVTDGDVLAEESALEL
ncbi:MAG TPA: alpha-2-macroglobulin family protein, partial [Pyrinomonadaceae bacterium]|nr:alpha-2-macroglobulin family protein [Pyrinomonadaceae bacterium]